ncbi:MAG TPA: hypothetical protein PLD20_00585 [Blastocatellia bacterium]|nr:hypothetical protein [Blastocatellia bacterium]HMV85695.1 hypothetical protein [Blastocatellia bacterium]HMX24195.1 hypothetical protein [Blastocatellia bacterium]HMY72255.1 hypothetical protein [Blastocatellia bacterium]HMZ16430.1 hypothetical protein [Blastocatellia bacterium]
MAQFIRPAFFSRQATDDTEGTFKINRQIGATGSLMLGYPFTNNRHWQRSGNLIESSRGGYLHNSCHSAL